MGIFGYQVTSLQDVEDQSTEDEALKKQMNYELFRKRGQRLVDLLSGTQMTWVLIGKQEIFLLTQGLKSPWNERQITKFGSRIYVIYYNANPQMLVNIL